MRIWLKRVLIVAALMTTALVLQQVSATSLWLNTTTDDELVATFERLRERSEQINDLVDDTLGIDPQADFERLFDPAVRHTFIIDFSQAEFDGLITDMTDYYEEYGTYKSNNYRTVTVTYAADDDVQIIENVGFRSKGNIYSRRLPIDEQGNAREIHFMLKFNETFDLLPGETGFNELKTREFANLERLIFKWNRINDPTYLNEVFSYEMMRQVGVPVPRAGLAEVLIRVDGKLKLMRLYNIFEAHDEEFLRRVFDIEEVGDLYKGQWSATLEPITSSEQYGIRDWRYNHRPLYGKETNEDQYTYDTLIRFTNGINQADPAARIAYMQEHFNIDSFLRAMAMNVLLGNPDDYRGNGNNMYYYLDQTEFMTYLPFDYDNSMGSGWDGAPAFINRTIDNDIYEWGWFDWNTFEIPLWTNLMEHEQYRIQYENYLEEFITSGLFSNASYRALFDQADALYGDYYDMYYDKTSYINDKIDAVLEDLAYHRALRN